MPSEKALQAKQEVVAQLKSKLDGAVAGVLVDYRGITVTDDTKLRRELREAGIDYAVVKNTLLRRALEGTEYSEMASFFCRLYRIKFDLGRWFHNIF